MKKKPARTRAKRASTRATSDLPARGEAARGGQENLVFTSVSNVLKTRHDSAKNSISNVR